MENKKTSELLDLLWDLENTPEDKQKDGHWDKVGEVRAELEKRPPFSDLFGENQHGSSHPDDMTHAERLEEVEGDIKLLKRHKHDDKSGDVLIRI